MLSFPKAPRGVSSSLEGIDCISMGRCIVVGTYSTEPRSGSSLIEEWNGSAWSTDTTNYPPSALTSDLHAVSCTPSFACEAVGTFTTSSRAGTFADSNG
jgi:hypothetical protein